MSRPGFLRTSKEDIIRALDTLDAAGETGIRAVCDGYPEDSMKLVLDGYENDIRRWIYLVKKIVIISAGSGRGLGGK